MVQLETSMGEHEVDFVLGLESLKWTFVLIYGLFILHLTELFEHFWLGAEAGTQISVIVAPQEKESKELKSADNWF